MPGLTMPGPLGLGQKQQGFHRVAPRPAQLGVLRLGTRSCLGPYYWRTASTISASANKGSAPTGSAASESNEKGVFKEEPLDWRTCTVGVLLTLTWACVCVTRPYTELPGHLASISLAQSQSHQTTRAANTKQQAGRKPAVLAPVRFATAVVRLSWALIDVPIRVVEYLLGGPPPLAPYRSASARDQISTQQSHWETAWEQQHAQPGLQVSVPAPADQDLVHAAHAAAVLHAPTSDAAPSEDPHSQAPAPAHHPSEDIWSGLSADLAVAACDPLGTWLPPLLTHLPDFSAPIGIAGKPVTAAVSSADLSGSELARSEVGLQEATGSAQHRGVLTMGLLTWIFLCHVLVCATFLAKHDQQRSAAPPATPGPVGPTKGGRQPPPDTPNAAEAKEMTVAATSKHLVCDIPPAKCDLPPPKCDLPPPKCDLSSAPPKCDLPPPSCHLSNAPAKCVLPPAKQLPAASRKPAPKHTRSSSHILESQLADELTPPIGFEGCFGSSTYLIGNPAADVKTPSQKKPPTQPAATGWPVAAAEVTSVEYAEDPDMRSSFHEEGSLGRSYDLLPRHVAEQRMAASKKAASRVAAASLAAATASKAAADSPAATSEVTTVPPVAASKKAVAEVKAAILKHAAARQQAAEDAASSKDAVAGGEPEVDTADPGDADFFRVMSVVPTIDKVSGAAFPTLDEAIALAKTEAVQAAKKPGVADQHQTDPRTGQPLSNKARKKAQRAAAKAEAQAQQTMQQARDAGKTVMHAQQERKQRKSVEQMGLDLARDLAKLTEEWGPTDSFKPEDFFRPAVDVPGEKQCVRLVEEGVREAEQALKGRVDAVEAALMKAAAAQAAGTAAGAAGAVAATAVASAAATGAAVASAAKAKQAAEAAEGAVAAAGEAAAGAVATAAEAVAAVGAAAAEAATAPVAALSERELQDLHFKKAEEAKVQGMRKEERQQYERFEAMLEQRSKAVQATTKPEHDTLTQEQIALVESRMRGRAAASAAAPAVPAPTAMLSLVGPQQVWVALYENAHLADSGAAHEPSSSTTDGPMPPLAPCPCSQADPAPTAPPAAPVASFKEPESMRMELRLQAPGDNMETVMKLHLKAHEQAVVKELDTSAAARQHLKAHLDAVAAEGKAPTPTEAANSMATQVAPAAEVAEAVKPVAKVDAGVSVPVKIVECTPAAIQQAVKASRWVLRLRNGRLHDSVIGLRSPPASDSTVEYHEFDVAQWLDNDASPTPKVESQKPSAAESASSAAPPASEPPSDNGSAKPLASRWQKATQPSPSTQAPSSARASQAGQAALPAPVKLGINDAVRKMRERGWLVNNVRSKFQTPPQPAASTTASPVNGPSAKSPASALDTLNTCIAGAAAAHSAATAAAAAASVPAALLGAATAAAASQTAAIGAATKAAASQASASSETAAVPPVVDTNSMWVMNGSVSCRVRITPQSQRDPAPAPAPTAAPEAQAAEKPAASLPQKALLSLRSDRLVPPGLFPQRVMMDTPAAAEADANSAGLAQAIAQAAEMMTSPALAKPADTPAAAKEASPSVSTAPAEPQPEDVVVKAVEVTGSVQVGGGVETGEGVQIGMPAPSKVASPAPVSKVAGSSVSKGPVYTTEVRFSPRSKRWEARLLANGNLVHVATFRDETAARQYELQSLVGKKVPVPDSSSAHTATATSLAAASAPPAASVALEASAVSPAPAVPAAPAAAAAPATDIPAASSPAVAAEAPVVEEAPVSRPAFKEWKAQHPPAHMHPLAAMRLLKSAAQARQQQKDAAAAAAEKQVVPAEAATAPVAAAVPAEASPAAAVASPEEALKTVGSGDMKATPATTAAAGAAAKDAEPVAVTEAKPMSPPADQLPVLEVITPELKDVVLAAVKQGVLPKGATLAPSPKLQTTAANDLQSVLEAAQKQGILPKGASLAFKAVAVAQAAPQAAPAADMQAVLQAAQKQGILPKGATLAPEAAAGTAAQAESEAAPAADMQAALQAAQKQGILPTGASLAPKVAASTAAQAEPAAAPAADMQAALQAAQKQGVLPKGASLVPKAAAMAQAEPQAAPSADIQKVAQAAVEQGLLPKGATVANGVGQEVRSEGASPAAEASAAVTAAVPANQAEEAKTSKAPASPAPQSTRREYELYRQGGHIFMRLKSLETTSTSAVSNTATGAQAEGKDAPPKGTAEVKPNSTSEVSGPAPAARGPEFQLYRQGGQMYMRYAPAKTETSQETAPAVPAAANKKAEKEANTQAETLPAPEASPSVPDATVSKPTVTATLDKTAPVAESAPVVKDAGNAPVVAEAAPAAMQVLVDVPAVAESAQAKEVLIAPEAGVKAPAVPETAVTAPEAPEATVKAAAVPEVAMKAPAVSETAAEVPAAPVEDAGAAPAADAAASRQFDFAAINMLRREPRKAAAVAKERAYTAILDAFAPTKEEAASEGTEPATPSPAVASEPATGAGKADDTGKAGKTAKAVVPITGLADDTEGKDKVVGPPAPPAGYHMYTQGGKTFIRYKASNNRMAAETPGSSPPVVRKAVSMQPAASAAPAPAASAGSSAASGTDATAAPTAAAGQQRKLIRQALDCTPPASATGTVKASPNSKAGSPHTYNIKFNKNNQGAMYYIKISENGNLISTPASSTSQPANPAKPVTAASNQNNGTSQINSQINAQINAQINSQINAQINAQINSKVNGSSQTGFIIVGNTAKANGSQPDTSPANGPSHIRPVVRRGRRSASPPEPIVPPYGGPAKPRSRGFSPGRGAGDR